MEEKKNPLRIPRSEHPRVVIIGGGFGGIQLAKKLAKAKVQVVLFDRNNYHTFQPLLYQVATAGLEPDAIAGPLRKLLENSKNVFFRMGEVNNIKPEVKTIFTSIGSMTYDYLVIASGSKTNYFGNDQKFELAFPLKQVPQALNLRSHILQNFEQAVLTSDQDELEKLLNIVIVGGGPTGVELSGALGELKKHVLPKDYPDLDLDHMNIYLVEGMDKLLGGMSDFAHQRALKDLKKFDVKVKLNTTVEDFDGEYVTFKNQEKVKTNTLVWAAGVTGNLISGIPADSIERNRYKVNHFNQINGYKDIFAVGDIAMMQTEEFPKGHPMLAPVAIQQGEQLANNLKRLVTNKEMEPFNYFDKGSMATVGRNKAVVDLPKNINFGGFFAWFVWMFIHLISIIGFRSKLVVLTNWIWNYFTYDRGTRLIIRPFKMKSVGELKKQEEYIN